MKQELKILVKYRLERAMESIEEAKLMVDCGHVHASVNRLYYSVFYVVSGLLLSHGLSSAKHNGVRSLFHQTFVKKGVLDVEWGRFYDKLYDNRQKGDYADLISFDEKEVKDWIIHVEEFVSLARKLIHFTDESGEG